MKNKFISIILFLLFSSCKRNVQDEELTMIRTPYYGKEIRLDGCYVSDPDELNKYSDYEFFYSDGVNFGFGDLLNINNITQVSEIDFKRKFKGYWGLYQVNNNTISIQRWKMNDVYPQFIIQRGLYKIINDTTLSIDLLNDGDITYYHFKHFIPKPDSTNVFIK